MAHSKYEFSESENATIAKAGLWAKVLGGVVFVEGLSRLAQLRADPLGTVIHLSVAALIGSAFFRAGGALAKVTETKGDDVRHLLDGLRELDRAFTVRIALMLLAVGLFVIAFAAFLFLVVRL